MLSLKTKLRLRRAVKNAGDAVAGALAVGALKLLRLAPFDATANFAAAAARTIGPLFKENTIARDNLMAVQFHPEKSSDAGLKILANFVQMVSRQPSLTR